MSRKEAVLLVSRALAMIQLVTVFIEITYLPGRLWYLYEYARLTGTWFVFGSNSLNTSREQLETAFLFARIAGLLFFAFLFWNCGPWIERVLLPGQEVQDQGDPEPGAGAKS